MAYYKKGSIPLQETSLSIGEKGFDEYGNYIQIDMFNEPILLKKSVLRDGIRVDSSNSERFLKSFWAETEKNISGYEILDED